MAVFLGKMFGLALVFWGAWSWGLFDLSMGMPRLFLAPHVPGNTTTMAETFNYWG